MSAFLAASIPGKSLLSALFSSSMQPGLPQPPGARLFGWHPEVSEPVPIGHQKVLGQGLGRSGVDRPLSAVPQGLIAHTELWTSPQTAGYV